MVGCVAALCMFSTAVTSHAASHSSAPVDLVAGLAFDVPVKIALDAKVAGKGTNIKFKASLKATICTDFTIVFGPTDDGEGSLDDNEFMIFDDENDNFTFFGTYSIQKNGDVWLTLDNTDMTFAVGGMVNGMNPQAKLALGQTTGLTFTKVTEDNDVKTKKGVTTFSPSIKLTFKGDVTFSNILVCLSGTLSIKGTGTQIDFTPTDSAQ